MSIISKAGNSLVFLCVAWLDSYSCSNETNCRNHNEPDL